MTATAPQASESMQPASERPGGWRRGDDTTGVVDHAGADTSPSMSRAIRRSVAFIESSFAQPVSLATLAATAGLSVSRFATLFRQEVGIPPHRYVCLVRIQHAKRLLRDGVPPCEVAAEVGFFDQSHLGRHFRRAVGVTPGHFVASPDLATDCSFARKQPFAFA